jgi:hypothetical protein
MLDDDWSSMECIAPEKSCLAKFPGRTENTDLYLHCEFGKAMGCDAVTS